MRGLLAGVEDLAAGLASTKAPGYHYWAKLHENLTRRGDDLTYLNGSTPMLMVGDPGFFIERIEKLQGMGMNEIVLKLDGYGHCKTMRSIELIGSLNSDRRHAALARFPGETGLSQCPSARLQHAEDGAQLLQDGLGPFCRLVYRML